MKSLLLALFCSSIALAAPSGTVPAGMPQKLSVGLFEDTGQTWMAGSGTKWDVRYRYLAWDWASNWGNGPRDGQFALDFFNDTATRGYMPAVSLYEIYDLPSTVNTQLGKMQDKAAMLRYFGDFKLLMQQVKTFNKPVLVLLEPDAVGFSQGETGGNPNVYASVADTGMPELAGLPNTVAGWGLAFLQVRKSVGASNAILGLHISGWATGADLFHFSTTTPLQPAVDSVYAFLSPLGLVPNVTGATYDVLVGDPLDRDADYYRLTSNEDRWWDISDTASVTSKSMNRYMEWVRLWNVTSGKRWVLWQVPLGTSTQPNTCAGGYKDNRSEWFFGANSAAHLQKTVDNGVVSVLFGEGANCQTTRLNDGNYLRDHAKAYLAGPGLPLTGAVVPVVDAGMTCVCTCTPNVIDAGTVVVDAGKPDSGSPAVDAGKPDSGAPDAGKPDAGKPDAGVVVADAGVPQSTGFEFEGTTHGFTSSVATGKLNVAAAPTFNGTGSLAVSFTAATGTVSIGVAPPDIAPGATITYHVWVPTGSTLSSLQVFAQESQATGWNWNAYWAPASGLTVNGWNTFAVTLPANASKIQGMGVEFAFTSAYTGTFYIDSITWNGVVVPVDAGVPAPDAGKPDAGVTVDAGVPLPTDAGVVGKTFKIHTIGDSTTESVNSAFRCAMYTTLKARGYNPVFVGTLTHPYGCVEANKHDGHAGWTAEDIAASMPAWIQSVQPDVIIYNSGTNTIRWWLAETGAQAGARQEGFIRSLFTAKPNVKVIVWTINPQGQVTIPPNGLNSITVYKEYNDAIRAAVAKLKLEGAAITLVDMDNVLVVADTYDNVHPSELAGQTRMAPAFINALTPYLP